MKVLKDLIAIFACYFIIQIYCDMITIHFQCSLYFHQSYGYSYLLKAMLLHIFANGVRYVIIFLTNFTFHCIILYKDRKGPFSIFSWNFCNNTIINISIFNIYMISYICTGYIKTIIFTTLCNVKFFYTKYKKILYYRLQ